MALPLIRDIVRAPLFLIAGPCVIESEALCLDIARTLKPICDELKIPLIFKASFDKANRSSGGSFRGPGVDAGLAVLRRVREECELPVLTDVHETSQVAAVGETVDVLQIPAFLARQTDLLLAAAQTGKAINVKKGQFMSPGEMEHALRKIKSAERPGNAPVMLTERGTFFGYNRLVNDFTSLAVMKALGAPVVFDVTHSTQQPGAQGTQSGGNPQFAPLLARAAVAAGVDGLFLECHPDPKNAKSDAATMLDINAVEPLLRQCKQLADLRKQWHAD